MAVAFDELSFRATAKKDGITHISTGVAVLQHGKLLVVRRAAHDDTLASQWELPGGGVDAGETIIEGATRELQEETGLIVESIIGPFEGFDFTTGKKPRVRQVNLAVTVKMNSVRLDPNEHDSYRWIEKNQIGELLANEVMNTCLNRAFALLV